MKKQVKVVMLPTERVSNIHKTIDKGLLYFKLNNSFSSRHINQYLYFLSDEEIKEGDKPCWCYNSIKNTWNNDIILYQGAMPFYHYKGFKKIIATTDESLSSLNITKCSNINCEEGVINGINPKICKKCNPSYILLPRPSNEFLKKYCELGGIDKVLVEYDEKCCDGDKSTELCNSLGCKNSLEILKVAPDNTISIYPITNETQFK